MADYPEFAYRLAAGILKPILIPLTRRDWRGGENLPGDGGIIVVFNHVTNVDPLTVAHYLYDHGRPPRFLAKSQLWDIPVIGTAMRALKQVPVYRGTAQAKDSLLAAEKAIADGLAVAIAPEGTHTREPDMWPMVARTGVARLALATGAPVIPVAQWGTHEIMPPGSTKTNLWGRKDIAVVAGPALDLSKWDGAEPDAATLREVTDHIMTTLTHMLEDIRGEEAPAELYDPRKKGQSR